MLICCNRPMRVQENGVGVDAGGCVYPGDRYVCLVCGRDVVLTTSSSVSDSKHEMFSNYVVLKEKPQ